MIALDFAKPINEINVKSKPVKMQAGGEAEKKLAEGPPENINILPRFEGFKPGPNQFMLEDQEKVISSEPNVQPRTMEQRGGYFEIPQDGPMSSEPDIISTPYMDRVTEGATPGKRFFYGPVIDPREVYPRDPDPGIMAVPPRSNRGIMGINNTMPEGILMIEKEYDI